jgi:hypothetical protein
LKAQRNDSALAAARLSLALAAAALLVLLVALLVPVDFTPFQAEEELLVIGPALAVLALVAAIYAWFRTDQRTRWHWAALIVAAGVLVLSGGFTGLLVVVYSHCPRAVC